MLALCLQKAKVVYIEIKSNFNVPKANVCFKKGNP